MIETIRRSKFILAIAFALTIPAAGLADEPDHPLMPLIEPLIGQHEISDIQFSPDGSRAALVIREPSTEQELRSTIWVYEDKSRSARRFTSEHFDSRHPRWSPDATTLAFLSARNDNPTQIYLMRMDGGEARDITNVAGGVRSFAWAPQPGRIAFTTTDPRPMVDSPKSKVVIGSQVHPPAELMIVDLASHELRKLIRPDGWAVGEFAWLPDGDELAITADDDYLPERAINRVFIASVASGELREIGQIDSVEFGELQVSPRGDLLSYVGSASGPTLHDLFLMPLGGGSVRNLTGADSEAKIDRPVRHVSWIDADELVFSTADGLGSTVRSVNTDGRATIVKRFDAHSISALDATSEMLLYAKSDAVTPVELWRWTTHADERVTDLHSGFPDLIVPETLRYKSSEDFEIEAMVYYPSDDPKQAPMVTVIHGGPTGRFSHSIDEWSQILAASGYVVFAPNIRGSIGYGEAFLMSNRADWGGGDFRDVIAGVDYFIEQGVADDEKLAIVGWSYGGYMSAWTTTQTQRFKAAVVGAAMLDLNVQWGAELPVIVPYDTWYLGTPWAQPENFRRMSPISHVQNVTTPTLLLVGEQDEVDHPLQNWQYFRALRLVGVPAELVVYPEEGHSIQKNEYARDVLRRMVDWVDTYLE